MSSSKGRKLKLTGPEEVALFLSKLKHPLRAEIETVRNIILGSDKKITEQIKWNAPSFCYNGEDRITFNLTGKGFFRLIFHCGAKVKNQNLNGRLFEDTSGLLEWAADDRAVVSFSNMKDILAKKSALTKTVKKWIELTAIKS